MTVSILCHFIMVPWGGLQCTIVVFPDPTHCLHAERDDYLAMTFQDISKHSFSSELNPDSTVGVRKMYYQLPLI